MDWNRKKTNVVIIDASAVTRYLLTEILEQSGSIEVVASVSDPVSALADIRKFKPHVVTFDITIPGTDGLGFLEQLMEVHPTPVVIVSALTPEQSDSLEKAKGLGAVAFVTRQSSQPWSGILDRADEIIDKIQYASSLRLPGGALAAGSF